jgi:hypothetical protein
MDGEVFLKNNPLPCQFSDLLLLQGKEKIRFDKTSIDTGDILLQM